MSSLCIYVLDYFFKGASNLTQLNTSPWPTTGTSPVQSQNSTHNWSNFANMSSTSSPANMKMGTGPVQHVTSHTGVSPSDSFAATPATNLQNPGKNF